MHLKISSANGGNLVQGEMSSSTVKMKVIDGLAPLDTKAAITQLLAPNEFCHPLDVFFVQITYHHIFATHDHSFQRDSF